MSSSKMQKFNENEVIISEESPGEGLYKAAQPENSAERDFLARMSHEIRTPINAIIGMNEMILRECREETVKDYAIDVDSSAKVLLGLVNDILDFSKIESGKMEVIPVEYELDSMLSNVINTVQLRAAQKDLDFRIKVQSDLPVGLYGDDVRIRQVLMNLLTNAIKYTNKGSVTLSVSGKVQGDKVRMRFQVTDTGIGIKEEDLPKLCRSFERIEEKRNRNTEGTGLGMNIVASLLALMGSKIEVESTYGKGSRFYFDLDQRIVDRAVIGDFEKGVSAKTGSYSYTESFTAPDADILVVDDNDLNRKVFKSLLKQTLVNIDDVSSGKECLDAVKKKHYDVIFMDHMMPDMDGVETLHHMSRMEHKCKDTPVAVLTADAVAGARKRFLWEGFDAFLSKPIVPEKLEKLISVLLPPELVLPADRKASSHSVDAMTDLPELDEFEWDYATSHLGDPKLLRQMLVDTYYSLKNEAKAIDDLKTDITDEKSLGLYRIRVHALKNTSAMVGALLLSKLARLIEAAAIDGDMERIEALHPILIEEMNAHRERLTAILPSKTEFDMSDVASLKADLQFLQDSLDRFDYDSADSIMEKLSSYEYSENISEMVEELSSQVIDLEAEAAAATAQKIYAALG